MKTKKIISVVLSIVMLVSVLSVVSFAGGAPYTVNGSATITVAEGYNLDKAHYAVSFDFAGSAYGTADGDSNEFTCTPTKISVTTANATTPVEYSASDDTFFSTIAGSGAEIKVEFTIAFKEAEDAFGTINANCKIAGFYKADKELSETTKFKSFSKSETVSLEEVNAIQIVGAVPASYKDSSKADLAGVELSLTLSDGCVIAFTPAAGNALTVSEPAVLTVDTTSVNIYFCGINVKQDYQITVDHDYPAEVSSIGATHHAVVCKGCGKIDENTIADHTFDNWTANDDATFLKDATETGTCTACGATTTRYIDDTAGYNQYKDMTFLYVIFDYIHLLLNIINGAIDR